MNPAIPEYMHGLIVMFIGARTRIAGDAETQQRSVSLLQLYEEGKRKAMRGLGEDDSYQIKNIYD